MVPVLGPHSHPLLNHTDLPDLLDDLLTLLPHRRATAAMTPPRKRLRFEAGDVMLSLT